MKIKFKKKILYTNLLIGIFWTGLGIFILKEDHNLRWSDYGFMVVGLLFIGHYLYDLTNQYLTIENGSIRKNNLYGFRKRINLNEISLIEKIGGVYILKTESKDLKINTELIEVKSLIELNRILTELDLCPEKTPFTNPVGLFARTEG